MSRLPSTLLLLVFGSSLLACDGSADFEECVDVADPAAAPGGRSARCPPSTFLTEDARGREVAGVVRRGQDPIPGALVRVEPSSGFATGKTSDVVSTVTDATGVFGGLRPVALRYDMFVKLDPASAEARQDVMVYRGVGARYIEPAIESASRTLRRAWTGRVDVWLDAPLPAGRAIAFFASGEGVYGVTGALTTGLSVFHRDFVARTTLHAVEYESSGGLETATAYGKVEVMSDASALQLAPLRLEPITGFAEPRFEVTAPSGFVPSSVDVIIGFTQTSDARLATLPVGIARKLPIIPNAGYTYLVRAMNDGAIIESGETGLDVYAPTTKVELPELPIVETPLEGETRGPGEPLLVSGKGVFEHVLLPLAGGPALRIITRQRDTALPDVSVLGALPAVGDYSWTVRTFPTARFPEEISGVNGRRFRSVATSKPRTITLR